MCRTFWVGLFFIAAGQIHSTGTCAARQNPKDQVKYDQGTEKPVLFPPGYNDRADLPCLQWSSISSSDFPLVSGI